MGASERSARSRQCGTSERVERIKLESSIAPSLASSYPYRRSGAARRTSDSNWRNCTACIQRLRIISDNAARESREWELQLALTGQMVQSHTFLTTQTPFTGISSHFGAKLRDWTVSQSRAGCYSQAALSSNDSKTLYINQRRSL